jgi:hypothetical protein
MSIKRNIIIPVILTLSTTGTVLAGTVGTLSATQAPAAVAAAARPNFVYDG